MRRSFNYSNGGKSDGTGCAIFIIMMICLPVIGFVFDIFEWIFEHMITILIVLVLLWIIKLSFKEDKMEREKEQEERDV